MFGGNLKIKTFKSSYSEFYVNILRIKHKKQDLCWLKNLFLYSGSVTSPHFPPSVFVGLGKKILKANSVQGSFN